MKQLFLAAAFAAIALSAPALAGPTVIDAKGKVIGTVEGNTGIVMKIKGNYYRAFGWRLGFIESHNIPKN